jgi:hypothetical protein
MGQTFLSTNSARCATRHQFIEVKTSVAREEGREAMFRRAMTAPRGGDQKSEEARSRQAEATNTDNVSLDPKHGNSRAYTLDRLSRRERPDLLAKVAAKQMSANAAAIEAGFRKKPSPFERVQKLLPELTTEQRRWLLEALRNEFDN